MSLTVFVGVQDYEWVVLGGALQKYFLLSRRQIPGSADYFPWYLGFSDGTLLRLSFSDRTGWIFEPVKIGTATTFRMATPTRRLRGGPYNQKWDRLGSQAVALEGPDFQWATFGSAAQWNQ